MEGTRSLLDIDRVREDTPFCDEQLFMNSAGASLMPKVTQARIRAYLDQEQRYGGYKAAESFRQEIEELYQEAATLLHCGPQNIAYAQSATDAYGQALSSIAFEPGDIIITSDNDYISSLLQFSLIKKRSGVDVQRVRDLPNGDLDLDDLERKMQHPRAKLVAIAHVPTNSGLVQDVMSIGRLCNDKDLLFLIDACQSVGQLDVDLPATGCDFAAMTGRKFLRAPRGTGLLYVSDAALERGHVPLCMDSYGATWVADDEFKIVTTAKRFELWEKSYALVLGMKETIRYTNTIGIGPIEAYNKALRLRLTDRLDRISGLRSLDRGSMRSNIITFHIESLQREAVNAHLEQAGVVYSMAQRHHALIDFNKKDVDWAVRLSPHYFNTIEEMDRVADVVEELVT